MKQHSPTRPLVTVDVWYPFTPHYREGVFRALTDHRNVVYQIFSGSSAPDTTIALAQPRESCRRKYVKNIWLGPLLVQPAAVRHALTCRTDAVIHFGSVMYLTTWLAAAILRVRRKKVYFWTIGWHRPDRGPKRLIRLAFYRLADTLLLYGSTAESIGLAAGYPADRMRVIGNSHDRDVNDQVYEHEDPVDFSELRNAEVIGAVIRPNRNKRLELLIEAARRLRLNGRNVAVCIVGDGPCREQLEDLARKKSVPALFPGSRHNPDVLRSVYERLRLTVVPEAVGLTAVHSLWYGRPVISNNDAYGQMPEYEAIKPGLTGDLYDAGDVDALTGCIGRWLDVMASEQTRVEAACVAEAQARWSSGAHANRITEAVLRDMDGHSRRSK